MEDVVKAEYIQKCICFECYQNDMSDQYIRKPYRKVVSSVKGMLTCTDCGRHVRGGFIVIYEYTG